MANRKTNIYLIFSLICMGVISYLSLCRMEIRVSGLSSWDKLLHMAAYGVLACLIYLALQEMDVSKRYLLVLAFAISFLYGVWNEVLQYFVPWREADILDATANGIGAFGFPLVLWLRTHYQRK